MKTPPREARREVLHEAPPASLAARMHVFVRALQQEIIAALEEREPEARFRRDPWTRAEGGGGLTAVIEEGAVFEKGGVNTSAVHGPLPEAMARAFEVEAGAFFATGLSIVLHPRSPHVPSVHANVRYFALGDDLTAPRDEWFGGGADLTPYYPRLEDVQHFHRTWKAVCERHPAVADYSSFKKACDDYFFLPHRDEARGVGGIFYDYVRGDPEAAFDFTCDAGQAFLHAYLPLLDRHVDDHYSKRERAFQHVRRGRYAEFNLIYDRGTKFGLKTGGRTESILMSLPPHVRWRYDHVPAPGTPEARALRFFTPRNWLSLSESDLR